MVSCCVLRKLSERKREQKSCEHVKDGRPDLVSDVGNLGLAFEFIIRTHYCGCNISTYKQTNRFIR